MSSQRSRDYLMSLLNELCVLPRESERVAFHSGRHCAGGARCSPQVDGLSALLGFGVKGGSRMNRSLDGYLITRGDGRHPGLSNRCGDRRPGHRAVLDGYFIGGMP